MSKFDNIHDKYIPDETVRKKGVKYERLAAVVANLLKIGAVAHDVRLFGESGVKHQIDVRIGNKRVLIECKDLDESQDKVGLETIRSFATVVREVKPAEAWVVTCVGFTKDALMLAKHEGIKLVQLREFQDSDWEGRIKQIGFTLTMKIDSQHRVTFRTNETDTNAFQAALAAFGPGTEIYQGRSGITLKLPGSSTLDVAQWLENERKSFNVLHLEDGPHSKAVELSGASITLGDHGTYPISGIMIDYVVGSIQQTLIIDSGGKIAVLLLQGLGDGDLVVWDADLKAVRY